MIKSKNSNGFIVKVIEKITEEGTYLKEKRVINNEVEALRIYDKFIKEYPELKVECFNYKTEEVIKSNF